MEFGGTVGKRGFYYHNSALVPVRQSSGGMMIADRKRSR